MTLKELLAKQQAIVDAAKAAHRDLTEEEQRNFDEYQAQIDALQPGGEPDDTVAVRQLPSAPALPTSPPCAVISVWMQSCISRTRT